MFLPFHNYATYTCFQKYHLLLCEYHRYFCIYLDEKYDI